MKKFVLFIVLLSFSQNSEAKLTFEQAQRIVTGIRFMEPEPDNCPRHQKGNSTGSIMYQFTFPFEEAEKIILESKKDLVSGNDVEAITKRLELFWLQDCGYPPFAWTRMVYLDGFKQEANNDIKELFAFYILGHYASTSTEEPVPTLKSFLTGTQGWMPSELDQIFSTGSNPNNTRFVNAMTLGLSAPLF